MRNRRWKQRLLSLLLASTMLAGLYQPLGIRADAGLGNKFSVTLVDASTGRVISDSVPIEDSQVSDGALTGNVRVGSSEYNSLRIYVKNGNKEQTVRSLRRDGDKVWVTLDKVPAQSAKLYYPVADSEKIMVDAYNIGQTVRLIYKEANGDVAVEGPATAEISGGMATARFTVSTPRNMYPEVSLSNGGRATVSKVNDFSVVTRDGRYARTIWQYEIKTPQTVTITASARARSSVRVKAYRPDGSSSPDRTGLSNDWQIGYTYAAKTAQDRYDFPAANKSIDIETANGTGVEAGDEVTRSYNSTVNFHVYHDRTFDMNNRQWAAGRSSFSIFLAAVHLNGQSFGAPQPFGRFGKGFYEGVVKGYPVAGSNYKNNPPYYESSGGIVKAPWIVNAYAQNQGYDPYWNSGDNNRGTKGEFYHWYYQEIMGKALNWPNNVSETYVQTGPLAGSTVRITLIDAKPAKWAGPLASIRNGERQPTLTEEYTRDYTNLLAKRRADSYIGAGERTSSWKNGWDGSVSPNGYWNSMRTVYAVTIENLQTDVDLTTEWFTSDNVKVGLYNNVGVENVETFAGRLGYGGSIPPSSEQKWRQLAGAEAYIETRGLQGSYADSTFGARRAHNTNPRVFLRGDVVNGYTDPEYVDKTAVFLQRYGNQEATQEKFKTSFWSKPTPRAKLPGSERMWGFYGEYPVFASSDIQVDGGGGGSNKNVSHYGGMNIVGISAKLQPVSLSYDLGGGQIANPGNYQSYNPDTNLSFDVKGRTVIHVGTDVPRMDGAIFKGWRVQYGKDGSGWDTDYDLLLQPGEDLRIDLTAAQRSPGFKAATRDNPNQLNGVKVVSKRITEIDGTVNFNNIRLQAEWALDPSNLGNGDRFIVVRKLTDAQGRSSNQFADSFIGLPGMYADLQESQAELAPETLTVGQGSAAKTYYRVLSAEQLKPKFSGILLPEQGGRSPVLSIEYREQTLADKLSPVGGRISLPVGTNLTDTHAKSLVSFPTEGHPENAEAQPDSYTYAFKQGTAPAADAQSVGETAVTVLVTYGDGSSEEVQAHIDFQSQADYWKEQNGNKLPETQTLIFDYNENRKNNPIKAEDFLTAEAKKKLTGVTYSMSPEVDLQPKVKPNITPAADAADKTSYHEREHTVTITFGDQSKLELKGVKSRVRSAADTFSPQLDTAKVVNGVLTLDKGASVSSNGAYPKGLLDPSTLDGVPADTIYDIRPTLDTSASVSEKSETLTVLYPDKTIDSLPLKLTVLSMAEKNPPLKTQTQEFDYASKPVLTYTKQAAKGSNDADLPAAALLIEPEYLKNLEPGTQVSVTAINTTPKQKAAASGKHEQTVRVTVTFSDQSTLEKDQAITVKTAAQTFSPQLKNGKILTFNMGEDLTASSAEDSKLNKAQAAAKAAVTFGTEKGADYVAAIGGYDFQTAPNTAVESTQGTPNKIVVTYQDESKDEDLDVLIVVKSEATRWKEEHSQTKLNTQDQTYDYNEDREHNEDPSKNKPIVAADFLTAEQRALLPQTAQVSMNPNQINLLPTTEPGKAESDGVRYHVTELRITLSFSDGSSLSETAKARVKSAADTFDPQFKQERFTLSEDGRTPLLTLSKDEKVGNEVAYAKELIVAKTLERVPETAIYAIRPKLDTTAPVKERGERLTILYPDKTSDPLPFNLTVESDADRFLKQFPDGLQGQTQNYDYSQDVPTSYSKKAEAGKDDSDANEASKLLKPAQLTALPKGSALTVEGLNTSPTSPAAQSGKHEQTVTLTLTFPDKSTLTVKQGVTVKTAADTFEPSISDQTVSYGTTPSAETLKGLTTVQPGKQLPPATTVTLPQPSTYNPRQRDGKAQTVNFLVTYPDQSFETMPGKITVLQNAEADQKEPDVTALTVPYGYQKGTEDLKAQITNQDELDAKSYSQDWSTIDTNTPGSYPDVATVTVTYKDDTSDTVNVPVTVLSAKDSFDPSGKTITVDFGHSLTNADAESAVDKGQGLPQGTSYEFVDPLVNTQQPGRQPAKVKVSYPDGTFDTVDAWVVVRGEAETWTKNNGALTARTEIIYDYNQDFGKEGFQAKELLDTAKAATLPSTAAVSLDKDVNFVPTQKPGDKYNGADYHKSEHKLTVTFSDGSKLENIPAVVRVRTAADTFSPVLKADLFSKAQDQKTDLLTLNQGAQIDDEAGYAKGLLDPTSLNRVPESTGYDLKPDLDTSGSIQEKDEALTVNYPDTTSDTLPFKLTVESDADRFLKKFPNGLQGQTQNYDYGQSVPASYSKKAEAGADDSDANEASKLLNPAQLTALPKGSSLTVAELNTSPTSPAAASGKHEQTVKLTLTFPDGSSLTGTQAVTVKTAADTFAPSISDQTVGYGTTPSAETLKGLTTVQVGKQLPPATTVTLPQPSTYNPQQRDGKAQTVSFLVTYPDQSSEPMSGKITVLQNAEADQKEPVVEALTVPYGYQKGTEDLKAQITNQTELDAKGYSQDWSTIDTTAPGSYPQVATVTVTYKDGTRDTVHVPVTVRSAADSFQPTGKTITVDFGHQLTDTDAEAAVDKGQGLPQGTSYTFVAPLVNTQKAGRQAAKVKITYPDQTSETVDAWVVVRGEAETWTKRFGNLTAKSEIIYDYNQDFGQEGFQARALLDETKVQNLPNTAQLSLDKAVDFVPAQKPGDSYKGADYHKSEHKLTVTFSDGSKLENIPVVVRVRTAADTFNPSLDPSKYPAEGGQTLTLNYRQQVADWSALAKDQLTGLDRVPESGTTYSFNPQPDTAQTQQASPAQIVLTYPDTTVDRVGLNIAVESDADRFQKAHGKTLLTQSQTFDYAHQLSADEEKSLIAEAQRNALPEGSSVSLTGLDTKTKTPANAPANQETKTLHQQAVTVTVSFQDGSTLSNTVQVYVKTAAETFAPTAKVDTVSFHVGERLEKTVEGSEPAVTRRQQAASQAVEFPANKDGSAYVLPVNEDGYRFAKTVDTSRSNAPDGQTMDIEIHYQDGSVGKVETTVLVESQADIWKRTNNKSKLTAVPQTYDYGQRLTAADQRAMIEDISDLGQVTLSIAPEVNTRPEAGGHNQTVTATLRFSDGSSLESEPIAVTIRTAADTFNPELSALTVGYQQSPSLEELKRSISDATKPQPKNLEPSDIQNVELTADSNFNPEDQSGTPQQVSYTITYTDGSTETVQTTITVLQNSDKMTYEPQVEPLVLPYGADLPDLGQQITNQYRDGGENPEGTLPPGTRLVSDPNGIDTKVPGQYTGRVQLTYPDGSQETVTVPVTVKTAAESFKPVPDNGLVLPFGSVPTDKDAAKTIRPNDADGKPLPPGTTVRFKEQPNTGKTGEQEVTVTVRFPDGSETDVTVTITIEDEATTWEKEHGKLEGQDQSFGYGQVLTARDHEGFIKNFERLPAGVTVEVEPAVNTKPQTPAEREQQVTVTVRFSDGSERKVTARAKIGPASDYYQPQANGKIEVPRGSKPGPTEAESAIITTDESGNPLFPEGTRFDFKDPIDTATPGDKAGIVVITYPDGSTAEVPVTVHVNSDAETFLKQNPAGVKTQDQDFRYGEPVTDEKLRGFIEDGQQKDLPEGTTVSVSPEINTRPSKPEEREQSVIVTIHFPDGSTLQSEEPQPKAKIGPASEGFTLEENPERFEQPVGTVLGDYPEGGVPDRDPAAVGRIQLKDKDGNPVDLPEGVTVRYKNPVELQEPGKHSAIVEVRFPDGSSLEREITVWALSEAEIFVKENGELKARDQSFDYGQELTERDNEGFLFPEQLQKLPKTARIEVIAPDNADGKINTRPRTEAERQQRVEIRVIFADGSVLSATAKAIIGGQAQSWLKGQGGQLHLQEQTFPYGHEVSTEDKLNFVVNRKDLPEGVRVEIHPEINTKPGEEGPWTQLVEVELRFPDGSSIRGQVQVHIEKPAIQPTPAPTAAPTQTGQKPLPPTATAIPRTGEAALPGLALTLIMLSFILLAIKRRSQEED